VISTLVLALTLGCSHPAAPPGHGKTIVTDTEISILEPIRFVDSTDAIATASLPTIDAVAATFTGNPSLRLIEVHASGPDAAAGERRARAIVAELVRRGVEAGRLRVRGEAGGEGTGFEIVERAK